MDHNENWMDLEDPHNSTRSQLTARFPIKHQLLEEKKKKLKGTNALLKVWIHLRNIPQNLCQNRFI